MPEVLKNLLVFPSRERLSGLVDRILGMNPHLFTGPGTNTYLVGPQSSQPLLIDTGSGEPAWLELLKEHLKELDGGHLRPTRCLLTHGHGDHVGGLNQLQETFRGLEYRKYPWPGQDDDLNGAPIKPLQDGEVISGPGYTLRAIHTPGHSPDHMCFLLEEEQALFTGDMVLGLGTSFIPREGGSLSDYLKSLRLLQELPLKTIYPGHGPVIHNPREKLSFYLRHRMEREWEILNLIREGPGTVTELVKEIYRDYPPELYLAAAQTVQAHLDKLLEDGRVEASDDSPHRYFIRLGGSGPPIA
ncbi:MAG: beta-lactamase-like protein 2 [Deltaproteobacteria bacterium]|nr:beta-lactamase-like protein 2 [Deltaproteobacteria bacterium]